MYTETIHETERYRVNLSLDIDGNAPYNDGGTPIIALDFYDHKGGWEAVQIDQITGYELDSDILAACGRCAAGSGLDIFERWLRVNYGITSLITYRDRHGTLYISFDPADWRDEMGIDDEYAKTHPVADMTEWIAYVNGDVWGLLIEEKVEWSSPEGLTMSTWEHVDSLWGLYGREYAEATALEEFGTFITDIAAVNEAILPDVIGVPV